MLLVHAIFIVVPAAAQQRDERLFDALARTPLGDVYHQDGSGDSTILMRGELVGAGPYVRPHPAVRAVVDLRQGVLPLLIRHLDDQRTTAATFENKPVAAGYLALDVLLGVVRPRARFFRPDCADDGLGACVKRGYYFRPDAPRQQMAEVRARWEAAYRRNQLQFLYPPYWK